MPDNNSDEIRDLFRDKFRDYEEGVNDSVWDYIKEKLHPGRKKRMIIWWAAAASITAFIAIYTLYRGKNQKEISDAGNLTKGSIPFNPIEQNRITNNREEKRKITGEENNAKPEAAALAEKKINYKKEKTGARSTGTKREEIAAPLVKEQTHNLALLEKIPPINPLGLTIKDSKELILVLYWEPSPPYEKNEKAPDWSLSANLLSAAGAGNGTDAAMESSTTNYQGAAAYATSSTAKTQTGFSMDMSSGNIQYFPPLITSITLNWQLSKRWGIESGLSYSVLKSKNETPEINSQKTTLNVQMKYLGIPMMSTFRVFNKNKFYVYLSQGILFEKEVSASYNYSYFQNSQLINQSKLSGSGVGGNTMASLLFGFGANYSISKHIGFYLQPDMAVYILRPGNIYNARSSKALWPSFQTGLRFQI